MHPYLKFLLRAAVTAAAIIAAFAQVEAGKVLPLLSGMQVWPVLAALAALHLSQAASALRTRFYLARRTIDMPVKPSLQLHYVGGMFNSFLPGGAGGDVYKAWWLKRHKQGSLLTLVLLMIAQRLNGLWILGLMVCALAYFSPAVRALVPEPAVPLLGVAAFGSAAYHLGALRFLKEPLVHQYHAARYSMGVQFFLAASAWCLCLALRLHEHITEYVILFLLSCILAMLPVSIGGIGVRELAVLHGSLWLGLNPEHGVALALAFSILNLSIPLAGAIVYGLWRPAAAPEAA